jgi:type IV fimbrial biogenesis protein FimT
MKYYIKGFNLIGLIFTLAIVSILFSISLPNLNRFSAQTRLDNAISSIFKSLHAARVYAVAHSSHMTLCPLVSAECENQWHNTIHLFEDSNANLRLDGGENVIKVIEKIDERDHLNYPRNAITYRPNGSINAMQSGSFIYCNDKFENLSGNRITVSQVGRVRVRDSNKCSQ